MLGAYYYEVPQKELDKIKPISKERLEEIIANVEKFTGNNKIPTVFYCPHCGARIYTNNKTADMMLISTRCPRCTEQLLGDY